MPASPAKTDRPARLTPDQEAALVVAWMAGDKVARDRLVVAQLEFVAYWARRYAVVYHLSYDDLYSEGTVGLTTAIDRYRGGRVRVSTYCVHYIRGWMRHWIRRQLAVERNEVALGGGGDNGRRWGTLLNVGFEGARCAESIDHARQIEALAVAAGKLPPIQRALVRLVYLDAKPMTLAQAAAHIGIAERTATRRMRQAIQTLRGRLDGTM